MRCRAVPCPAMRCGAAPCCAVLRSALDLLALSYMPGLIRRCKIQQYRDIPHQVCTCATLLNHTPNSAQLIYSSAARSAAPCGAVPFLALRCNAEQHRVVVPRAAVRCATLRCCAVLRAVLYLLFRTLPGLIRRSIIQQ